MPEFVWLACGGKTQLNAGRLAVLRHRRVLLFPDGDAFAAWQTIADEAAAQGQDVRCSDLIERQGAADEKAEGVDLADYLLASVEHEPPLLNRSSKPMTQRATSLRSARQSTNLTRDSTVKQPKRWRLCGGNNDG